MIFSSFTDSLPALTSPNPGYFITSTSSPGPGIFSLSGTAPSQNIIFTPSGPFMTIGNYTIEVTAITSLLDQSLFFPNTATFEFKEDDSCKAYVANGIVVQARQNRKEPGYSYS